MVMSSLFCAVIDIGHAVQPGAAPPCQYLPVVTSTGTLEPGVGVALHWARKEPRTIAALPAHKLLNYSVVLTTPNAIRTEWSKGLRR